MNKRTNDEAIAREKEHAKTTQFQRVEVLPAKQTPTPLTDAVSFRVKGFDSLLVLSCFAQKLEIERAALLAMVERVASGSCNIKADEDLKHTARTLLAQLKP